MTSELTDIDLLFWYREHGTEIDSEELSQHLTVILAARNLVRVRNGTMVATASSGFQFMSALAETDFGLGCVAANDSVAPSDDFAYVPQDLNDAVERWLPCVRKVAAGSARAQEVDDLLQDIWLELHRHWTAVVSADSPLGAALRIAKRRAIKWVRAKRARLCRPFQREELSEAELAAQEPLQDDPEQHAVRSQHMSLLWRILDRLDERQRDAFLWRHVYGFTGEETAKLLNTTTKQAYLLEEEARMRIEAEWKRWDAVMAERREDGRRAARETTTQH